MKYSKHSQPEIGLGKQKTAGQMTSNALNGSPSPLFLRHEPEPGMIMSPSYLLLMVMALM